MDTIALILLTLSWNISFITLLWFAKSKWCFRLILHFFFILINTSTITYGSQSSLLFSGRANVPDGKWITELFIPLTIYFCIISASIYLVSSKAYSIFRNFTPFLLSIAITLMLFIFVSLVFAAALLPS